MDKVIHKMFETESFCPNCERLKKELENIFKLYEHAADEVSIQFRFYADSQESLEHLQEKYLVLLAERDKYRDLANHLQQLNS